VNGYRKHGYETVANCARHLVAKWKQLVQVTSEVEGDSVQCAPAGHNDHPRTADVDKNDSDRNYRGRLNEHHLGTSSSKQKPLHTVRNITASKHHSSATVMCSKVDKHGGDDEALSHASLPTEVSAASLTRLSTNDCCADGSNKVQNQSAALVQAHLNASAGCHKSLVGHVNIAVNTNHKAGREKHSKLNKPSAQSKLSGKSASKTRSTAEIEKKSHANSTPDKHPYSSVDSSAKTRDFGRISSDQNEADLAIITIAADDVDQSEHKGMTFEQMLNYDNHVRKKKSVHRASKYPKVLKPSSYSSSSVSHYTTNSSSKHASCLLQTVHSDMPNEFDESELSRANQQRIIPHPHSQVGTDWHCVMHFVTLLHIAWILICYFFVWEPWLF